MTRAVSPPVGCQKPHPPSPFTINTQLENRYSFYHPVEGRRLSRPRHCSKAVQPVPKAVCSPCPRLYVVVVFTTNMQLPMVGCEPWSSHTAVRHVTARPLRPALYIVLSQQLLTAIRQDCASDSSSVHDAARVTNNF